MEDRTDSGQVVRQSRRRELDTVSDFAVSAIFLVGVC